jgi:hypothetical protein
MRGAFFWRTSHRVPGCQVTNCLIPSVLVVKAYQKARVEIDHLKRLSRSSEIIRGAVGAALELLHHGAKSATQLPASEVRYLRRRRLWDDLCDSSATLAYMNFAEHSGFTPPSSRLVMKLPYVDGLHVSLRRGVSNHRAAARELQVSVIANHKSESDWRLTFDVRHHEWSRRDASDPPSPRLRRGMQ